MLNVVAPMGDDEGPAAPKVEVQFGKVAPEAAQIVVDGTGRGTAPVRLDLKPGTRFQIVASKDGFVDATLDATAETEKQLVSVALALKPEVATSNAGSNATKPANKTPAKRRPSQQTKAGSAEKPGFDPNEVGGD